MTQPEREKICAILAGPIKPLNRVVAEEFLIMAALETDHLEPLIDEMVDAAYQRGLADGAKMRGAA